jgi:integrase
MSGLTVKRIKRITKPGRHGDGNGLYLQVTKDGVKSWLLRYARGGRERCMGLGPLHTVTLDEARERARLARQQLLDGIDPINHRQTEQRAYRQAGAMALTFAAAAQTFHDQHSVSWRNAKHRLQFIGSLKDYAFPIIGKLPVSEIDEKHVLRVLEQRVKAQRGYPAGVFWNVRRETASRVRQRIESVLNWATVRGHRSGENPARWQGFIQHALPKSGQVAQEHHPALPYRDLPAFMHDLRQREGIAAQALQFAILTAARTGEVIGAQWSEIDLDQKLWTVPAGRMKAQREHRVPLSTDAVDLLRDLYTERGNNFLFIGPKPGAGLSNAAMASVLRRLGRDDVTVHGFRSSFRDWAGEVTAFPSDVIEMALAHQVGSAVEKAYRRGDLLDKRRKLMTAWAQYCRSPETEKSGAVVPLRGR